MRTANRCLFWMLIVVLLLGMAGTAQDKDVSFALRVMRSISTGYALPGSTFRVTLQLEADENLYGVGIRERLPLGWTIHPVDNAESLFRQVDGMWVFPQMLSKGTRRQLVYDVSVPAADALYGPSLPHCFSIQGTYQSVIPSVEATVTGDLDVKVVSFLPMTTAIAHLVLGEEGAPDTVDLRLSRTIRQDQLARASDYWVQDRVVPHTGGATIDHALMGRLVAYYETCTDVDIPLPMSVDPKMRAVRQVDTALPCTSILFPEGCHDPGDVARELAVRVEITVHHDAYGVSLKETLPSGWRVTPVDHSGFLYRPSAAEWVYMSRVRAGETLSVVYKVDAASSPSDEISAGDGCCGRQVMIEGEALSALACSATTVGGDDRVTALFCLPVLIAISRWDPVEDRLAADLSNLISFDQMQRAVQFWQEGLPVPHTCGYTVGYELLQRIVSHWLTSTPVTDPLPGDPPALCPSTADGCRSANCTEGWMCYLLERQDPGDLVGLPEPPDVRVDAGADRRIDCFLPTVELRANTMGGIEPFRFEWIGPTGRVLGHEPTLTVDTPGEYTVTAISCGGCMATDTVAVSADFAIPQVAASVGDVLTGYVSEVLLHATVVGGMAPFLIEWSASCGDIVGTGLTIGVRDPGEYKVIVTGANGCASEDTVRVLQDIEPPVVEIAVVPDAAVLQGQITLTCPVQEIALEGTITGGREPYNLVWVDDRGEVLSSERELSVIDPGAYTLNVTGANGIRGSATANVLQDVSEPAICVIVSGELTCAVDEVELTVQVAGGRAPFAIAWIDEAGDLIGETAAVRVDKPGEYTAIVIGANGCSGSASVQVGQDTEPPTVSISGERGLTCNHPTIELTVSAAGGRPPYEYTWLDGAGDVLGEETVLAVSSPGTYTARVAGANGCSAEDVVIVGEDLEPPCVEATVDGPLSCARDVVQLHANIAGGRLPLSIVWTDEQGKIVGTSALVTVGTVGAYTVKVTGANGCSDLASVVVVQDMVAPTAAVHASGQLTCANPETTLIAEISGGRPPYTVEWRHPSGQAMGGQTAQIVTDPGMYAVTVWGQNGCSTTVTVVVQQDVETPDVKAFAAKTITCAVSTVELTACPSGGRSPYTYQWTDGSGRIVGDTAEVWVSEAGEYAVAVTGANGCTGTAVVTVLEDLSPPVICIPETVTLTCAEPVFTVDPSISSGRTPYAYRWTDECDLVLATTARVHLDFPGTYTLTVTGSNGCSSTARVRVVDGVRVPLVDAGPDQTLACLGDEALLTVAVDGGAAPYLYSWVNACNEIVGMCRDLVVSTPGTYIVTVQTADGCVGVDTVNVFAPGP